MKLRKLLALLLAGVMAFSAAACGEQEPVTNNGESSEASSGTSEEPLENKLVIGAITQMKAEFYDANFCNDGTNYSMYDLLHGYTTVVSTKEGEFVYDPTVVKDHSEVENDDGTKTYTVTINDGLVWSDGTPITAKDYVFAVLLESSPEMAELAYPSQAGYYFVGYDEFYSGSTKNFAGVHLVDEMTYSVTVKAEELPFHYDISYASQWPRPIHVIAPDCDVVDAAEGATITGDFTSEVLEKTVNDPETGYRANPSVVCGPYTLSSFDVSAQEAVFKINPNYTGDYRGVKPSIETVVVKLVSNDTMMNELKAGNVDLLSQTGGAENIEAGLDLADEGLVEYISYYRNGYGKVQFDCSKFPTDSENVRQAIAYCLDRNEFVRQYTGGYGSIAQSAYGLAQWEYQESIDWIAENLNAYEMNVDKAIELLEADGWTLGEDGQPYSGEGVRYKEVDGELKPLVIEWANSEGNPVSALLATMLPENMEAAGMQLNPTTMDFSTLSAGIAHTGTTYNMYNLATGIPLLNSPWYYYSKDPAWMQPGYNSNWIADDELDAAAGALKTIPYEDRDAWLDAWRNFMKVWNEKMPDIPLYSDEYFDFYAPKLKNWEASDAIWPWSRAILDASIG